MTWAEYQICIERLVQQISAFLLEHAVWLDMIVPILRGGGIPAVSLSYRLRTENMYPIRLYHDFSSDTIGTALNALPHLPESSAPVILLVDDYHATGSTAGYACDLIRTSIPHARIILATLGRDAGAPPDGDQFLFSCFGFLANELKTCSDAQCAAEHIINQNTIYPWEIPQDEMENIARLEQDFYPVN